MRTTFPQRVESSTTRHPTTETEHSKDTPHTLSGWIWQQGKNEWLAGWSIGWRNAIQQIAPSSVIAGSARWFLTNRKTNAFITSSVPLIPLRSVIRSKSGCRHFATTPQSFTQPHTLLLMPPGEQGETVIYRRRRRRNFPAIHVTPVRTEQTRAVIARSL